MQQIDVHSETKEEKFIPTAEMLAERAKWAEMTPEEKKAKEDALRAELKEFYARRPSRKTRMLALGLDTE